MGVGCRQALGVGGGPTLAEQDRAKGENPLRSGVAPTHTGVLQSLCEIRPCRTVFGSMPVRLAIRLVPPQPSISDITPATHRRCFSLSSSNTTFAWPSQLALWFEIAAVVAIWPSVVVTVLVQRDNGGRPNYLDSRKRILPVSKSKSLWLVRGPLFFAPSALLAHLPSDFPHTAPGVLL